MTRFSIEVDGVPAAHDALRRFEHPELGRRLDRGLLVGGRRLVPYLRAAAPRGSNAAHPLARSIRARKSRTEPHLVLVGPTSRLAHLLIGGTRSHDIAPRRAGGVLHFSDGGFATRAHVSGIRANPWPTRAAAGHDSLVSESVAEELAKP